MTTIVKFGFVHRALWYGKRSGSTGKVFIVSTVQIKNDQNLNSKTCKDDQ